MWEQCGSVCLVCGSSYCTALRVVDFGFTILLTSQVISVAFYSEREKSVKFCSEALVSA